MLKIAREVAEKEIIEWLDFKKVGAAKRETYKDNIDALIDAVAEGVLTKEKATNKLTYTLRFEVGEEKKVNSLTFEPRLLISKIHEVMKGEKSTDADARVLAYISALTGCAKGIIKKLDTEDYSIPQAIALFFM